MVKAIEQRISQPLVAGAALVSLLGCVLFGGRADAATITAPSGYTASLFAADPAGASQPDSVVVNGNNVFIGYGNGTKSDGSDGLPTTIAQYTLNGQLVNIFSVPGHNDGLRINPANGLLYALENQDGNPLLAIINPKTSAETTYKLPAEPGRGYDDLQFINGQAFVSISNPVDGTSPVLGKLKLSTSSIAVTPVLTAGAAAVDSAGKPVTLNIQDPDSLGISPDGSLLLDDQDGQALISVSNPGTASQQVSFLPHPGSAVDDTVFAPVGASTLFVAATSGANEGVYQISGPFTPGTAYTSVTASNFVGILDPTSGAIAPFVSGPTSPHGLGFASTQSVPEPQGFELEALTVLGLGSFFLKKKLAR